ncbi:MAG: WD40 repeat domain-containing protein [Alphaproteobacteria bacterium]|nr:WD40 repeat domain-containing protein [Alphaproteobacteria bacterium]
MQVAPLPAAIGLLLIATQPTVTQAAETEPAGNLRALYAVSQAASTRGSIAVYDIAGGHRLVRTIQTVPGVHNIKGVAASATTGRLYVAYNDRGGAGMVYCLNLGDDTILWNRKIVPGVDRLAIRPDGQLLYVPTGEDNTADHINVVDANTGDIAHKVRFSKRSHDTQFPLSGPLFQETKAEDGSGNYLYRIDAESYLVARTGPYAGILGPYAVDSASRYVVNNVTGLWGMQVADLRTDKIATADLPEHPDGSPELMHGIGWTPDETEVWQSSNRQDPHIYIWSMRDPMAPVLKQTLSLQSGRGSHWLTFSIKGDYAYIAPTKNSDDGTEIFDTQTHTSSGVIASSEDMLEIDFENGKVVQVGDQYGIGRK